MSRAADYERDMRRLYSGARGVSVHDNAVYLIDAHGVEHFMGERKHAKSQERRRDEIERDIAKYND